MPLPQQPCVQLHDVAKNANGIPLASVLIPIGIGALLWIASMLGSFFRPDLSLLNLIAVPLMWVFWLLGVNLMIAGAVVLFRRSPSRRGSVGSVVGALAMAVVVVVVFATVGMWSTMAPRTWFATHRALYQQALATDPGTEYYGTALPVHLRFLTSNGHVSAHRSNARFFPQWIGFPDDAGGYWYSPDRSPEGFDMYGMLCDAPADLGGGWWMCGMRD